MGGPDRAENAAALRALPLLAAEDRSSVQVHAPSAAETARRSNGAMFVRLAALNAHEHLSRSRRRERHEALALFLSARI